MTGNTNIPLKSQKFWDGMISPLDRSKWEPLRQFGISRARGRVNSRIYALRHLPGTQRRTRSDSPDGRVFPRRADPAIAADRECSAGEERGGGDGAAFQCRHVKKTGGIWHPQGGRRWRGGWRDRRGRCLASFLPAPPFSQG